MRYIVEVKPLEKPRNWEVVHDFFNPWMKVPAGFRTDGASIPIGLRWLFPHGGPKFAAAVVHDYLYRTGKTTRKKADEIFYNMMIANGEVEWKAKAMYAGVRAGGWVVWNKRRQENG